MAQIVKRIALQFNAGDPRANAQISKSIIQPVYLRDEGTETCLYILVDDGMQSASAEFFLLSTDEQVPTTEHAEWLCSYVRADGHVWHLFIKHRTDKGHRFWPAHG